MRLRARARLLHSENAWASRSNSPIRPPPPSERSRRPSSPASGTLHGAPQGTSEHGPAPRQRPGLRLAPIPRTRSRLQPDPGVHPPYTLPGRTASASTSSRASKKNPAGSATSGPSPTLGWPSPPGLSAKHDNSERPHQPLTYQPPTQYLQSRCQQAA